LQSKYFFEKHKKTIDEDHQEFDTYQEKTKIEFKKCQHKKLDFVGNELRCLECGNAWQGSGNELKQLHDLLSK